VFVGDGVETAGCAGEPVIVGGTTRVAKDCGQIPKHNVIVVRLRVQELRVVDAPAALLNLLDERVPHLDTKLSQRLGALGEHGTGEWAVCCIFWHQVNQALASLH